MRIRKARHRHLKFHAGFMLVFLVISAAVVWQKWRPVIAPGTIDRTTLTPQEKDLRYGYVNDRGQWAILPSFRCAYPFVGDRACVSFSGEFCWIDRYGKVVVPSHYSSVGPVMNGGLAIAVKDGKSGFVTDQGELVIDTIYDTAESFRNEFALVSRDGKYGVIDRGGRVVIPLIYDTVLPFEDEFSMAKDGLVPRNTIPKALAPPADRDERALAAVQKNGKWGFIDRDANVVIDCTFESVRPFREFVPYTLARLPRGWARIDRTGKVVAEPECMGVSILSWHTRPPGRLLRERVWFAPESEGLYPVNIGGEVLWNGLTNLNACIGGKWGYMNAVGVMVIQPRFDRPGPFHHGFAEVVLDGELVHINVWGNVVDHDEVARVLSAYADVDLLFAVMAEQNPASETALENLARRRELWWADNMAKNAQENARMRAWPFHPSVNAHLGSGRMMSRKPAIVMPQRRGLSRWLPWLSKPTPVLIE